MKYTFKKKRKYIGTSIKVKISTFDQITEIAKREGITKNEIYERFLEVAASEYWREREVKKKMKRVKPKGITASVKRSKPILKTGTSYCQFSRCPDKGQNYLTKNMLNYDKLVFCSESCVDGFKRDQNG